MSKAPVGNILIVSAILLALLTGGANSDLFLAALAIGIILLIIFGERSALELRLEEQGWPGREAWAPLIGLAAALALGAIGGATVRATIADKLDIIVLILSFAMLSFGLGRSGFFEFAAHHFVVRAKGRTGALVINMYLLSSLLTYVTSNDIVVLVLTPIIFSICVNAGIKNAKLILLSQFVAANTVSMGLLIGSPTNIIVSDTLDISFFAYFALMLTPSLISFAVSLVVVDFINRAASGGRGGRHFGSLDWRFQTAYAPDQDKLTPNFTVAMARWLGLFGFVVVAVAFVTQINAPLLWCAIPTFLVALAMVAFEPSRPVLSTATQEVLLSLRRLPHSIIAFGLVFFVFAAELAARPFSSEILIPALRELAGSEFIANQLATVFGSGLMVNLFNDLPAAALIGRLYAEAGLEGAGALVSIQAALIGLNIGCYVTPIGALAGLIWFNILRAETTRQAQLTARAGLPAPEIQLPTRVDLVLYGLVHFCVTGLVCALISSAALQLALGAPASLVSIATLLLAAAAAFFVVRRSLRILNATPAP